MDGFIYQLEAAVVIEEKKTASAKNIYQKS
jgi:hypothetical protein